jgi:hypothetical protein
MTRTDLLSILRPRHGDGVHVDRAVGLALQYGWRVVAASDRWTSFWESREIHAYPLATDADFAVFCHEGGHLEDPRSLDRTPTRKEVSGRQRISIECEVAAWLWAICKGAGHRWNQKMQQEMETCLRSYQPYVADYPELQRLEMVLAYGEEMAKQVVRLRPLEVSSFIQKLQGELNVR